MAKTNAVARVQAAKTNPFKKDRTLADMKRTWRGMTPAQRKDNAELFSKVAKGKPKGSAPKPAATKPAKAKPAKAKPVTPATDRRKPAHLQLPVDGKTTAKPAKTTKQGPRAGSRANPGSGSKKTTTTKPARTRAQNRRSSSTAQSRATAARRRGLANNRRQAEQAARERVSKNSVFRSSYRRANDARKK